MHLADAVETPQLQAAREAAKARYEEVQKALAKDIEEDLQLLNKFAGLEAGGARKERREKAAASKGSRKKGSTRGRGGGRGSRGGGRGTGVGRGSRGVRGRGASRGRGGTRGRGGGQADRRGGSYSSEEEEEEEDKLEIKENVYVSDSLLGGEDGEQDVLSCIVIGKSKTSELSDASAEDDEVWWNLAFAGFEGTTPYPRDRIFRTEREARIDMLSG